MATVEEYERQIRRLARTILIATRTAGGRITRKKMAQAMRDPRLAMLPTNGETSDALRMLRDKEFVRLEIPDYIDFGSTVIIVR